MFYNECKPGMRVTYMGTAPGLYLKNGTILSVEGEPYVSVRLDGVPNSILTHPKTLTTKLVAGGITTAQREYYLGGPPQKLNDGARLESSLPNDSDKRKEYPLFDVLFGYFPAAMNALAHHAYKNNEKHNPGQSLQWSRTRSSDHANCALRHLQEGDYEALLWRAAALLQLELEKEGAPLAPLATFPKEEQ